MAIQDDKAKLLAMNTTNMAALAQIEAQVNEFVTAIKCADSHIARLAPAPATPSPATQTNTSIAKSAPTDPTQQGTRFPSDRNSTSDSKPNNNPTTTTPTAAKPSDTPTPEELLASQLSAALAASARANAESRQAFLIMRQQWFDWGEGVMRAIEGHLGRWDLGIAERIRLVGLADRMGWYGVRMGGGA